MTWATLLRFLEVFFTIIILCVALLFTGNEKAKHIIRSSIEAFLVFAFPNLENQQFIDGFEVFNNLIVVISIPIVALATINGIPFPYRYIIEDNFWSILACLELLSLLLARKSIFSKEYTLSSHGASAKARRNEFRVYGYMFFIPFMMLYLSYIGAVSYFTLATLMHRSSEYTFIIISLLYIAVVYVIVRYTGYAIHRYRKEAGIWRFKWMLAFQALFVVSGYGFLASNFVLIEGPFDCREALTRAIDSLTKLQAFGQQSLPVPEYEETKKRVLTRQAGLEREILNPSAGDFCGVGPSARRIIDDLHDDLPGVRLIAGTDRNHSCGDRSYLHLVVNSYREAITAALAAHPLVTQYHITERNALLAELDKALTNDLALLAESKHKLAGVTNFILNIDLYQETTKSLDKAATDYSALYQQLAAYTALKNDANLGERLDTGLAGALTASPVWVLNPIISRLNRATTWLYVFIVFAANFVAAYIASTVFARLDAIDKRRRAQAEATVFEGSDVAYLWEPLEHPDRTPTKD
jgi:hypothetical protein